MILAKPLVEPPPNPLASGARVTVHGLQSKPELNGERAIVLEFDKTTGRYTTMLLSGKEVALKPANVQPDLVGEAGVGAGSGAIESGRGHAAAPLTATTPGLKGAAQLNGQAGHIVNWNVDGRRRYGVRLEGSGKLVSCPMRSVVPLDKPWLAYPHDFECSSTEIVATLQSELRAQGSSLTVLDWTPLAAAVSDVVYLLHVAHEISLIDFVHSTMQAIADDDDADGDMQSKKRAVLADYRAAQDVLIFVLSDAQTAPFFLAHREFISPGATIHSNAEIAAVPWLAIGKGLTIVPQPWEQTCKKEYVVRLHSLVEHAAAPGGVAIFERADETLSG
ncbi:hypothetical protein Ctob_009441 [Chrysochromulina tobinii]|uniref:Uncharacterized protein n=1 Tax=Chrysochromulina tobinii TaxID=1460289 RepID=A0A0M0JCV3_9EUKA|nr:hypothetical protein Ctob_009441 [Chrysochromulina tobinii]|eukprot:KOO24187.1 hypothetical protein Ctob_009441 [Chrysochromulina sp. CCMP291]